MKPLIVILAICTLGYVVDHWRELTERHMMVATADTRGLIIYSNNSLPACVLLEAELKKRGISYTKRELNSEAASRELTEKLARVGKMSGSIHLPVADIDGVMIEGVSIQQITRRMR